MTRHDNLIKGEWVPGIGYSPNLNPSNLADVIGEYARIKGVDYISVGALTNSAGILDFGLDMEAM